MDTGKNKSHKWLADELCQAEEIWVIAAAVAFISLAAAKEPRAILFWRKNSSEKQHRPICFRFLCILIQITHPAAQGYLD